MPCMYTTQLPLAFNPIGNHETFLLERDRIYTVFYPFGKGDSPQRVRVQATNKIWVRFDGGEPAVNSGFEIQPNEIQDWFIHVAGELVKIMTPHNNVYLQAQWLGFPLNGD